MSTLLQGVILSGGKGTRIASVGGRTPKAMVPLWGQPFIFRIIMFGAKMGISRFIVVVRPEDESHIKQCLKNFFDPLGLTVDVVVQEAPLGPGDAIAVAAETLSTSPVTVFLADTYLDESLPIGGDWVAVADAPAGNSWCWVESDGSGRIVKYWDKCPPPLNVRDVACGIYSFGSSELLLNACRQLKEDWAPVWGELQISSILEAYAAHKPLSVVRVTTWKDLGDRNSYIRWHRESAPRREFNAVTVDEYGFITKSSANGRVADEINWYCCLDSDRARFTPRLLQFDPAGHSYSIEFLDLPTLSDLFLYEDIPVGQLADIIKDLLSFMEAAFWYPAPVLVDAERVSNCYRMYVEKTLTRYKAWPEASARHRNEIRLNGHSLPPPELALCEMEKNLTQLSRRPVWGFIHGDFHFSNILYSRHNGHFRLIDPRGRFGDAGAESGGDVRYDLAKLRHSYHGLYDALSREMFTLRRTGPGDYSLKVPKADDPVVALIDETVEQMGYSIREIKWIEAALFLSILPLHNESPDRQEAFWLTGLDLVRQLLAET